jgi:steroid 5-alpha reductase family enzyme
VNDFACGPFLAGLGLTLLAVLVVFGASWLIARRLDRVSVVDVTWGLSFAVIAAVAFVGCLDEHANGTRRAVALMLTSVWGLRLAWHIASRSRGAPEDPRYVHMLDRAPGSRMGFALTHVFLPQALIAWFVSLPVQVAMAERSSLSVVGWVGAAVWLLGATFETVGDAQLAAFKRQPDNAGKVLDRGLWRYTRHPNYFGDACVWFGLWIIAAQQWQGVATVLSPVAMTWFLVAKTGKPMLEKQLMRAKPGYADYVQRTSGFVPLPPRSPKG